MVWFWLALLLALGLLGWRSGRKGTRRRSDPGVGYHAQHHSSPSEFGGGGGN
jgi:hypothetical protein